MSREFLVNTTTAGDQFAPSIAVSRDGSFVIAWTADGQDGSDLAIYAQRFDAAGTKRGSEFRVNTATTGRQFRHRIAVDEDGDFVVVWQSVPDLSRPHSGGIFGQRYNASGVAQGGEFQVNPSTNWIVADPDIAMDSTGNFVVTWNNSLDHPSESGVFAQRYNAAGVKQGNEIHVADRTHGNSSVAMDAQGNFVVVSYQINNSAPDDPSGAIRAQRYNAAGVAQGSAFRVNTYTTSYQIFPSVAMDADGNFVVAWQSDGQDGSGYGVYAQRYNAEGVAQGSEFRVNTSTPGDQIVPNVGMIAGGGFVITWTGADRASLGIYAQRYDAAGVPRGREFPVNEYTTNTQMASRVGMDRNGKFVITWSDFLHDGAAGGGGVFARAIVPSASISVLGNYYDQSILGGPAGNPFFGFDGNDTLDGDPLLDSFGNVLTTGGNDTMDGGAGNDVIRGLGGDDLIFGADGADDANGNMGQDTLFGEAGADVVRGGQGNDVLYGGEGDDAHVNGNIGNDTVYGGAGNDLVFGGQNNDRLYGEAGNDTLSGDLGNDFLTGGAGGDRFTLSPSGGLDAVLDFSFSDGDRVLLARGTEYALGSSGSFAAVFLRDGSGLVLSGITAGTPDANWVVFG